MYVEVGFREALEYRERQRHVWIVAASGAAFTFRVAVGRGSIGCGMSSLLRRGSMLVGPDDRPEHAIENLQLEQGRDRSLQLWWLMHDRAL